MRAVRTDHETVAVDYEIFVTIEAESEEEARQKLIDGDYWEEDVDDYITLGTETYDTIEKGEIWPDTIDILSEEEVEDDEADVEEPTSQFP
jgi:hypothetical protein